MSTSLFTATSPISLSPCWTPSTIRASFRQPKKPGAKGINLLGMCCSGAEMLSRHGIPHAGNFMSTEAILVTGAVDAMGVDVQCIKQGLAKVADCYGTRLFTTNPRCHIEGVEHIEFHEHKAQRVHRRHQLRTRSSGSRTASCRSRFRTSRTWVFTVSPTSTSITCWAAPSGPPTPLSTTTSSTGESEVWQASWGVRTRESSRTMSMWNWSRS